MGSAEAFRKQAVVTMNSKPKTFDGIKIWNIDTTNCYCLVPYEKRGIMGNKYVISTYMKDGRFKYLQYEISKREAEMLMTFGTLKQKKEKKKSLNKAVVM